LASAGWLLACLRCLNRRTSAVISMIKPMVSASLRFLSGQRGWR